MFLRQERDWQIKWAWYAPPMPPVHGELYIAGFGTHEAAIRYGRMQGWVT